VLKVSSFQNLSRAGNGSFRVIVVIFPATAAGNFRLTGRTIFMARGEILPLSYIPNVTASDTVCPICNMREQ